jgi:NAD(P)-dependent dehydrogenase (short-subunit alcohol dehydrogenase family)
MDTLEDELDRTIDVNLKGSFLCTRAVLPFMSKNISGIDFLLYTSDKDKNTRMFYTSDLSYRVSCDE